MLFHVRPEIWLSNQRANIRPLYRLYYLDNSDADITIAIINKGTIIFVTQNLVHSASDIRPGEKETTTLKRVASNQHHPVPPTKGNAHQSVASLTTGHTMVCPYG